MGNNASAADVLVERKVEMAALDALPHRALRNALQYAPRCFSAAEVLSGLNAGVPKLEMLLTIRDKSQGFRRREPRWVARAYA